MLDLDLVQTGPVSALFGLCSSREHGLDLDLVDLDLDSTVQDCRLLNMYNIDRSTCEQFRDFRSGPECH